MAVYLAPRSTQLFNINNFAFQDKATTTKDLQSNIVNVLSEATTTVTNELNTILVDFTTTVDLEANYVTKAYKNSASVSIGDTASSVVTIADTAYANTATTTSNPSGSRLVSKAPLLLPVPYSSNWTNVPLIMSGVQTITNIVSTSAWTGGYPTFIFYKSGPVIMMHMPPYTFSTWGGLLPSIQFDFSGHPELYPKATFRNAFKIWSTANSFSEGYLHFNSSTGIFSIYRSFLNNDFTSGANCVVGGFSLAYFAKDDGIGY